MPFLWNSIRPKPLQSFVCIVLHSTKSFRWRASVTGETMQSSVSALEHFSTWKIVRFNWPFQEFIWQTYSGEYFDWHEYFQQVWHLSNFISFSIKCNLITTTRNLISSARGSYCISSLERPFCARTNDKIGNRRCCSLLEMFNWIKNKTFHWQIENQ